MDEFAVLYGRYYQDVYRFSLFLTGDRTRAEDLASETFVRAWLARDRIRHSTVRSYLLTIARNLHRDECRLGRTPPLTIDERAPAREPGADVRALHRSELRHVRERLQHVPAGDRRALLLYVVRGMSYTDIASRLGVSVGAVKSRIARARDALRVPVPAGQTRE